MMRVRARSAWVLVGWLVSVAGCGAPEPGADPSTRADTERSRLVVYVVNYPLFYFAERIGGPRVQVEFPAPPDGDPAFWSPDPDTVAAYQQADLVLLNGAGYAKWVGRVTLPLSRLVDTSAGFGERYLRVDSSVTHSHGPGGEHSHGDVAFTTWLDPTLALEQARSIRDAFASAMPEHEGVFAQGFDALERDLSDLDGRLEQAFSVRRGQPLLASHPVYQYLARRYDLDLESVHFEPDEDPAAADWGALEKLLAEHRARWMLWEAPPLESSLAKLRALGVESVVFNPCGNVPPEGDYLSVMRGNVAELQRAFGERP